MSWFGPGYPIKKPEQSEVVDKTEPKAAESFREDSKTAPSYVRVASASSSEFDEAAAHREAINRGYDSNQATKHSIFESGARFQHAKDAEEIADWIARDKYSQKVRTDQAEQIAELTEENQRLRSCFLDTEESNADMYSKCKKAEERIEQLTAALFQILNTCDRSGLRDQHVEVLYCRNVAHEALAADSGGADE